MQKKLLTRINKYKNEYFYEIVNFINIRKKI
jgi:hypothetical protein